ncbi:hypothetical protein BaRGS_00010480 [Batillaria attramentaria]|uniref:Uncharacterized protein n=1 Tax=Batillaria attramentaria TaxID=370345 RepID=A0ABD0LFU2_9CAEN
MQQTPRRSGERLRVRWLGRGNEQLHVRPHAGPFSSLTALAGVVRQRENGGCRPRETIENVIWVVSPPRDVEATRTGHDHGCRGHPGKMARELLLTSTERQLSRQRESCLSAPGDSLRAAGCRGILTTQYWLTTFTCLFGTLVEAYGPCCRRTSQLTSLLGHPEQSFQAYTHSHLFFKDFCRSCKPKRKGCNRREDPKQNLRVIVPDKRRPAARPAPLALSHSVPVPRTTVSTRPRLAEPRGPQLITPYTHVLMYDYGTAPSVGGQIPPRIRHIGDANSTGAGRPGVRRATISEFAPRLLRAFATSAWT